MSCRALRGVPTLTPATCRFPLDRQSLTSIGYFNGPGFGAEVRTTWALPTPRSTRCIGWVSHNLSSLRAYRTEPRSTSRIRQDTMLFVIFAEGLCACSWVSIHLSRVATSRSRNQTAQPRQKHVLTTRRWDGTLFIAPAHSVRLTNLDNNEHGHIAFLARPL